jgi:hypothetical protein
MIRAIMDVQPHDRLAVSRPGNTPPIPLLPAGWEVNGSFAAAWSYGLDLAVIQHLAMPDVTSYLTRR